MFNFMFFFNNFLLGTGLAMDAFSVSLANGLNEPCMKKSKSLTIAGVFALFQGIMPMLGWICVHTLIEYFTAFQTYIPIIALVLLLFIGGKMVYEGITSKEECVCCKKGVTLWGLMVQGVATSIDALSVGFTIAEYNFIMALVAVLVIAIVTFAICYLGVYFGKKFGTKLSNKATILGGAILILIGIEIFVTSLIG